MTKAESIYSDIIDLPHHRSQKHPAMPLSDRAAQFAPFAALTGFDEEIAEAERYTSSKTELDESEKMLLNEKLQLLSARISSINSRNSADLPYVSIVYYTQDLLKSGGKYTGISGKVKKVDIYKRLLEMEDGVLIPIDDIFELEL